jgi:long-subunit acyl-CoA synthetase (AMP-forming)
MTPKWMIAVACAVVASVALCLTFFRTSEEERIRKVLDELTMVVAIKEGDTILSRTARVRSGLQPIVDDDVRVNVAELNIDVRGRAKLEEDAIKVGLLYRSADCDLTNVRIKLDPQATVATVDAVARVTASRGGERQVDERDVHFLLRKDGDWKIRTIDVAPRRDE